MKIELEKVRDWVAGDPIVVVRGRAGSIEGVTGTPLHRLLVGKSYDAEIDINDLLIVKLYQSHGGARLPLASALTS